jgi:hypothetical protein
MIAVNIAFTFFHRPRPGRNGCSARARTLPAPGCSRERRRPAQVVLHQVPADTLAASGDQRDPAASWPAFRPTDDAVAEELAREESSRMSHERAKFSMSSSERRSLKATWLRSRFSFHFPEWERPAD